MTDAMRRTVFLPRPDDMTIIEIRRQIRETGRAPIRRVAGFDGRLSEVALAGVAGSARRGGQLPRRWEVRAGSERHYYQVTCYFSR